MSTLNLQLLDDLLLSLIVDRELVEKTISQKLRIGNDELITTIEAAEELNHLINLFLNVIHRHLLEICLLGLIGEKGDVLRSLLEFVHELLEALITSLLESHVILE